jgi:predicted Zn-dependent protease with MMP-like domain
MSSDSEKPRIAGLESDEIEALISAWDAYESGELDASARTVERLMRRTRAHAEVRFLQAVLRLELGEPAQALVGLDACAGAVEDELLHAFYRGLALFDLARFEEAETALVAAMDLDPGTVRHQLAHVREYLGRHEEAAQDYAAAHARNPDEFPLPLRISRSEFEAAVLRASRQLPEPLREKLDEVPIVVEDLPPRVLFSQSQGDSLGPDLLGLFVGCNVREESVFEVPGIPPAIYIYQRNLERACRSREQLIAEIRITLYHELGHYLGLDEDELHERDLG